MHRAASLNTGSRARPRSKASSADRDAGALQGLRSPPNRRSPRATRIGVHHLPVASHRPVVVARVGQDQPAAENERHRPVGRDPLPVVLAGDMDVLAGRAASRSAASTQSVASYWTSPVPRQIWPSRLTATSTPTPIRPPKTRPGRSDSRNGDSPSFASRRSRWTTTCYRCWRRFGERASPGVANHSPGGKGGRG